MQKTKQSLLLLISLGITWSLAYSIARYCTTHGVHPLGYTFWQSIGPAIVLTLLCFIKKIPMKLSPKIILFYLLSSLIGIAIPNANMYYSASQLPSGILAVIINTAPIITYLLAMSFKTEKFSYKKSFGVLLAITGIYIIANPSNLSLDINHTYWILRALITPFCFALCAVYIAKYRPENCDSLALSSGMLWGATLWLAPIIFSSDNSYFYTLNFSFNLQQKLIILEILLSSLGYWLFFQLLQKAGAIYYSLVAGVVAIAGLFWGWLFFQESLQGLAIYGTGFIIIGILIVSLFKKD